jgi:hypothetical protein
MAYHHTLEHYKEQFKEAEDQYNEMMKGDNAASVLMKWFVENDVTIIFYPLVWTKKNKHPRRLHGTLPTALVVLI